MTTSLPWAPLVSSIRSGRPETTLYGILCADGLENRQVGDIHAPLWARSLLKPWQLMVVYPVLKATYPQLTDAHYALMLASQQGDIEQIERLQEILRLGGFSEAHLHCPACTPLLDRNAAHLPDRSPLNHPCSGKHLAYLLALQAQGNALTDYLSPELQPYQLTRQLLGYLLERDFIQAPETKDGCGMPNMALNAAELARLYRWLAYGLPSHLLEQAPEALRPLLSVWPDIARIMHTHPRLVGGKGRLDTRLMQGEWLRKPSVRVITKEGAEGLLGVGLSPCEAFPEGLGILLKLSSGYELRHLETIIYGLFKELGLVTPRPRAIESEVCLQFYFGQRSRQEDAHEAFSHH